MEIKLLDASLVAGWDKNPRIRDPERFELIKLSLRIFGFVMPLYVNKVNRTLYSGHQRSAAAIALGYEKLPVVELEDYGTEGDAGVNILFNLCTNDHLKRSDFGEFAKITAPDEGLDHLKSLPVATNPFPCMDWQEIVPVEWLSSLPKIPNLSAIKFAMMMHDLGIQIPVVKTATGRIINGAVRLAAAAESGFTAYPAVTVSDEAAGSMEILLNRITMSFDLQRVFGEKLRYNSFFRRRNQAAQRVGLGVGFYVWAFPEASKHGSLWIHENLSELKGDIRKRFIAEHGNCCIDFGAGRMDNTRKLVSAGIECIAFEPYQLKPRSDAISYSASRLLAIKFLSWLKSRPKLTSVFCSSVFNSVPFEKDRELLMRIFQALCSIESRPTLYLWTLNSNRYGNNLDSNHKMARERNDVLLDAEPGLFVSNILSKPKVQKMHSKDELIALGFDFFEDVRYESTSASHGIKCSQPRAVDLDLLREALEFEFDLPYPGERRMGLASQAIAAFEALLGKKIEKNE